MKILWKISLWGQVKHHHLQILIQVTHVTAGGALWWTLMCNTPILILRVSFYYSLFIPFIWDLVSSKSCKSQSIHHCPKIQLYLYFRLFFSVHKMGDYPLSKVLPTGQQPHTFLFFRDNLEWVSSVPAFSIWLTPT